MSDKANALKLLAAEDERQGKLHELLETIREQIRTGVEPEHRPDGLFKNIQDAVYAMRGRTPLLNDAAIVSIFDAPPAQDAAAEHCPTCSKTDFQYSDIPPLRFCADPWHADNHLRQRQIAPHAQGSDDKPVGYISADVLQSLQNDNDGTICCDNSARDFNIALYAHPPAERGRAKERPDGDELMQFDLTSDERWNKGCDFAMEQLCKLLGIDQGDVLWDAATETVDGDVQSVLGNILRAKYGGDYSPKASWPSPAEKIGEDWSCAADFLDDIEVNAKGMCKWADVANAQTHIRAALRSVCRPSQPEIVSEQDLHACYVEYLRDHPIEVTRMSPTAVMARAVYSKFEVRRK